MFQTKKQKVLIGLMGIALIALAVDNMSQGPAPAQARPTPAPVPAIAQEAKPAVTPPVAVWPERSVGNLLRNLRGQKPRDLDNKQSGNLPQEPATPEDPGLVQARQFAQSQKLTAVMRSQEGGFAIINNQIIRKGDSLKGFKLIEVSKDAAVFERGEYMIELKVDSTDQ